jgi:tetratricopeptide (TPR) repeat protein
VHEFARIASTVLWCGLSLSPCAASTRPVAAESIHWLHDYREARRYALSVHQLMIVDIETDWCTWCKVMDADVYPAPLVTRTLSHNYVFLRQNAEISPAGIALQRRFRISTYPVAVVVEPSSELYKSISGYRGPDALLSDIANASEELRHLATIQGRTRSGLATVAEREELAEAFANCGLHKRAANLYAALLHDPDLPHPPEELFKLAVSLASAGESRNALSILHQLNREFPGSAVVPMATALEAEIYLHDGQIARAKQLLQSWLAKYPDDPLADHVRSLLLHN